MKKKDFKCVSHIERMADDSLQVKVPVMENKCDEYYVSEDEVDLRTNRIVKTLKLKKVISSENFKNYKVSDFCLENLQASGAIANLKNCKLEGSTIASIDSAVAGLEALDNINISEE